MEAKRALNKYRKSHSFFKLAILYLFIIIMTVSCKPDNGGTEAKPHEPEAPQPKPVETPAGEPASGKLNIVWLVQDHVSWKQYMDAPGPKPDLQAYKRLAADGMAFTNAHTVLPICSPARASMLTGVYPHNHKDTGNDEVTKIKDNFAPYKTFNQYMGDYTAAYFGKWHASNQQPSHYGFQGFSLRGYGNPYATKQYKDYLKRFGLPAMEVNVEWNSDRSKPRHLQMEKLKNFYGKDGTGFRPMSTGKMTTPVQSQEAFFVTSLANDWLEKHAEDKKPFIMRVDVWGPHPPYYVGEPYANAIDPKKIPEYPNFKNAFADRPVYQQEDREKWRAATGLTTWTQWQPIVARAYENFEQSDAALNTVLDTLQKTGLDKNTIVIYTADHGDVIGSNGGLMDKDAMMTEEVMRIPLVVKWPGVTDGGKQSNALVANMDIAPTVIDMAKDTVPKEMDGKSMAPLLKNQNDAAWRDSFMAEHYGHKNQIVFQRLLYYKQYKYVAHLEDKDELYDLSQDPFEMKNLVDDPGMSEALQTMRSKLAEQMAATGDNSEIAQKLLKQMGITQ